MIVENFEVAARRNLADGGGVPAVALVTVGGLDKYRGLWLALGEHLAPDVVEADPLADVAPGLLHHRVAVDVGEQPQAEPVALAGVREAVHGDAGLAGVEGLPHPGVQLVVGNAARCR